ncbi:hypothetical protein ANANG_G00034730 [Anguilla anguilla]|uniref:Structure-specific endonuclease subunit SLX4 n=1 Tax=Anguilla anguilla TaxID=7936 RepID=A0A9D3MSY7_ANGAN|nr:hypothetical protein ANANG_G00034730 [Anguilla anguilla]
MSVSCVEPGAVFPVGLGRLGQRGGDGVAGGGAGGGAAAGGAQLHPVDPELYGQVLRYEPLVLSQLQARLKARGIRLAAAKLLDFLDSQCITFTTAKPAKPGPPRGRGRGGAAGGDGRPRPLTDLIRAEINRMLF